MKLIAPAPGSSFHDCGGPARMDEGEVAPDPALSRLGECTHRSVAGFALEVGEQRMRIEDELAPS